MKELSIYIILLVIVATIPIIGIILHYKWDERACLERWSSFTVRYKMIGRCQIYVDGEWTSEEIYYLKQAEQYE